MCFFAFACLFDGGCLLLKMRVCFIQDPGKMDDATQTSNGAPPSIAQSVVSVMTGQNTMTRKHRRTSSSMNNPKKAYEEVPKNN